MLGYVRIALLTNEVSIDGVELALDDRECELLTFLCLAGGYADAESLASMIWPHELPGEAVKFLWTSLTRLHKALPNPAIIRNESGGYRLDAAIAIDLWEIDVYLRGRRVATRPRCTVDELLYRRFQQFAIAHRFHVAQWAWSHSLRLQIDGYRREVGVFLGRGLLEAGRVYHAYRIAKELVAAFPSTPEVRALLYDVERRLADSYLLALPKAG